MGMILAFLRCRAGATAVEAAIVSGIFMAVLVGVFGVGFTMVIKADIENSIAVAERYALINDETDAKIKEIIRARLTTYDPDKLTLSLQRGSSGGVDFVKAQVSYRIDLGTGLAFGPISISATRIFPT
ncbi:hypothetical protein [Oricola sp.]|uniref:TadE/TadG family type IV pilus assembly protein n=1 Tax=Oricola sp. TaxID=1979950 RepID=UPI0025DD536D|nr:hypothetical protein [Oricola sp.]MCI5078514.1 hypothetical protein [Oricola sp.]